MQGHNDGTLPPHMTPWKIQRIRHGLCGHGSQQPVYNGIVGVICIIQRISQCFIGPCIYEEAFGFSTFSQFRKKIPGVEEGVGAARPDEGSFPRFSGLPSGWPGSCTQPRSHGLPGAAWG